MIYKAATFCIIALFLSGCEKPPEKHTVYGGGAERGVRLTFKLENGGTATLVCPKLIGEPRGIHGRECYLTHYTGKSEPVPEVEQH